jgi:hypothetical protein
MGRCWIINTFVDGPPHMFKESAENSGINRAYMMMRVKVKLSFGHNMIVVGRGFISPRYCSAPSN